MKRFGLAVLVLVWAGCGGEQADGSQSPGGGSGNVSFGGQQDIGEFRGILESGGIPGPETLDANGFFNEHYAAPPAVSCTSPICLTPGVAVGRDWLIGNHQATLQIAVSTNIDPATLTRKPLNLVVVVDRSGSMVQDQRLEKVKAGLKTLVTNLQDTDRLALVQFDDVVDTLVPFGDGLNRTMLLQAIDNLTPRGATNIYGGLEQGFELSKEAFSTERQNRVIFLSDGLATAGNTVTDSIISMSDGFIERGIGLTTIGVGLDFDVHLMRGLAEHGAGNFYFLEDAAAASEVFTDELDYFVQPLALDVRIEATAGGGWLMGEQLGSSLWSGSTSTGSMKVPAVFVSSRTSQAPDPNGGRRGGGSMIYIHLTPTGHNVDGKVADLKLTYRLPGSTETITDTVTLAYPFDPAEVPTDTYLSTPEMAKRFAMYNTFLGLRFATKAYDRSCARAALNTTRAELVKWNTTHEDPDVLADLQLIDMYLSNLGEYGTTTETTLSACGADNPYSDDPGYYGYGDDQVMACSAGKSSRGFVFVLIAGIAVMRRRRRS